MGKLYTSIICLFIFYLRIRNYIAPHYHLDCILSLANSYLLARLYCLWSRNQRLECCSKIPEDSPAWNWEILGACVYRLVLLVFLHVTVPYLIPQLAFTSSSEDVEGTLADALAAVRLNLPLGVLLQDSWRGRFMELEGKGDKLMHIGSWAKVNACLYWDLDM